MSVEFKWLGVFLSVFVGCQALRADPLDSWPTWSVAQPYVSKQVPPGAMIMRGKGTDAYYVLEVDPATGEIPVALSGGGISIDFSGPTGDPVPADAGFVGGVDQNGDLRGLAVDTDGQLQVDVLSSALPAGAATETTLSAINTKTPALGQTTMTGSSPVVIANNQSAVPVSGAVTVSGTVVASNFPTTVDAGPGAGSSNTLRVTPASRSYSDSANYSYTSGNVTTGAWTQVIASTAGSTNLFCITDTSGQVMEIGVGAAASESRVFLTAQGWSGCIPLRITTGARISVRAVTATATSGYLTIVGLN